MACVILTATAYSPVHAIKALIVDTDGKNPYYYRVLQELSKSCNFECSYKNMYNMLEQPEIDIHNDALFFFASPRFVSHLEHELSHEILSALKAFGLEQNKLIILLLPNHASPQHLTQLIHMIALPTHISAQNLVYFYLKHIGHPNAQSGKIYGTSLINKCTAVTSHSVPSVPAHMLLLPHKNANLNNTYAPLCIAVYNKKHNNLIALLPATDVTFADIAENFHKNPHALADRNALLSQVQQLLWELRSLHAHHSLPTQSKPPLPECLIKKQVQKTKPFSAAWLEPKDFYLHEEPQANAEDTAHACWQGCSFLRDCNFDLLWFEVNPEWYFSPRGLYAEHTHKVMDIMKKIGTQLQQCSCTNKKLPAIFIGSDITSNFNGPKPKQCVYDLYGTEYPNIPSPFDTEHLWQQELLNPFKACYTELHKTIPINGLFLDFEMYHAPKQASSYHDLMDFSSCAWRVFTRTYKDAPVCTSVAERVAYLKKNKLFNAYFTALTKEASAIGAKILKQLNRLDPGLRVAIYAPTLPSSWFYRGIARGLSTKKRPLTTATFNTDYGLHKEWLTKQGIHLTHGTALMMSKLQHKKDSTAVQNYSQGHDFVWYNRPSRQLYQSLGPVHKNKWWTAEYSPLANSELAHSIRTIHAEP